MLFKTINKLRQEDVGMCTSMFNTFITTVIELLGSVLVNDHNRFALLLR